MPTRLPRTRCAQRSLAARSNDATIRNDHHGHDQLSPGRLELRSADHRSRSCSDDRQRVLREQQPRQRVERQQRHFADKPLATIDYAVGLCTANNDDHIIVGPGHVETITTNGGLALDVDGITIIGIGSGNNRPRISFSSSTSARMTVAGDNITMRNVRFTGDVDAVTIGIIVSGAHFTMTDWAYDDVTGQIVDFIRVDAAGDYCTLARFDYRGATAAGTNAAIACAGADRLRIHDFWMDGNFAVGGIDIRTTAATNLLVYNAWSFRTRNAADIFIVDTITGSNGQIGPNINIRLNDNATNVTEACTGATFVYMQPIRIVNNAGESSMETNITATTDA
ncbi:MAG: hypothetical protein AB7U18_19145 [Dehalococcoidia bacterium]